MQDKYFQEQDDLQNDVRFTLINLFKWLIHSTFSVFPLKLQQNFFRHTPSLRSGWKSGRGQLIHTCELPYTQQSLDMGPYTEPWTLPATLSASTASFCRKNSAMDLGSGSSCKGRSSGFHGHRSIWCSIKCRCLVYSAQDKVKWMHPQLFLHIELWTP